MKKLKVKKQTQGEEVLRELILSERYRQSPFNQGNADSSRIREIEMSSEILAALEHPTSFVFFRGGNGVVWVVESQLDAYFDEHSSTQATLPFKIIQVPL